MNVAQAVRAWRKRWWIPLVVAVVAVAAVFALTPAAPKSALQYQAKAILILNPNANQPSSTNLDEAVLEATVGAVPKAAATKLHYTGNPAVLASEVNVSANPTVGTLTVTSSGVDGGRAALLANTFATALNRTLTQTAVTNYQGQVSAVEVRLKSLQSQINQYNGLRDPISQAKLGAAEDQYRLAYDQFQQLAGQGQPQPTFDVLQTAVPVPSGAARPPLGRSKRVLIAGVFGLLVGLGIALALEMLRPTILDRSDAERELGAVVLAEIPSLTRVQRRRYRDQGVVYHLASVVEAHHMLRTAIALLAGAESDEASPADHDHGAGPQVILVTSPLPQEGKSTTVANLAVAMAEAGRTVLACDADFRAPSLHASFGLAPGPGLADLLDGGSSTSLAQLATPTDVEGVLVVQAGVSFDGPAELATTGALGVIEEARTAADVVLIDTAPLLVVSDTSELLALADAIVMVVRVGSTTRAAARQAAQLLERGGIPLLGVVLVGARSRASRHYYGYRGQSYRQGRPSGRGVPRRRASQPASVAARATARTSTNGDGGEARRGDAQRPASPGRLHVRE